MVGDGGGIVCTAMDSQTCVNNSVLFTRVAELIVFLVLDIHRGSSRRRTRHHRLGGGLHARGVVGDSIRHVYDVGEQQGDGHDVVLELVDADQPHTGHTPYDGPRPIAWIGSSRIQVRVDQEGRLQCDADEDDGKRSGKTRSRPAILDLRPPEVDEHHARDNGEHRPDGAWVIAGQHVKNTKDGRQRHADVRGTLAEIFEFTDFRRASTGHRPHGR